MSDLPTGIEKTYRGDEWTGYRAFVWVPWPGYPKGRNASKRFPRTATLAEMRAWREETLVDARRRVASGTPPPVIADGFLADADRYLEAVQALPQFAQRKYHIELWAQRFGDRLSTSIEAHEIRAARDEWLTRGPKWVRVNKQRVLKNLPLSPQEVNLRLRALENLWTTLWPRADNIVRQVPECRNAAPSRPRGVTFAIALAIIEQMPDTTRPVKGGCVEAGSLSRIRMRAMLFTGLTPKQLGMLQEADVDFDACTIVPPLRLKGRPSMRRPRPARTPVARAVLPVALPELRQLFRLNANVPFSRSSLRKSVQSAVAKYNAAQKAAGLPGVDPTIRPYDLTRHTFGTEMLRKTGDLHLTQKMLGHSDPSLTEIYAKAAVNERLASELLKVNDAAVRAVVKSDPPVVRLEHPRRRRVARGGEMGGEISPVSRHVLSGQRGRRSAKT